MESLIAKVPPVGYWIEDGRGKWMGPFGTEQEAIDVGICLCPDRTKSLKLVVLGEFMVREVSAKIPKKRSK